MTKKKEKIKPETYQKRREQFRSRMKADVAVFPPAPEVTRSDDQNHPYWPDLDLYYLTGNANPGTYAVLFRDHPDYGFVLFSPCRDPEEEVWTGEIPSPEEAAEEYRADEGLPADQIEEKLEEFVAGYRSVCTPFGRYDHFDETLRSVLQTIRASARSRKRPPVEIRDPSEVLHEMRMRKTPEELNLHRRAIEITWKGLIRAFKECRSGLFEYELEAMLDGEYRRRGAVGNAFKTIVAGGDNATVLHYHDNEDRLNAEDLVLIDTGASYQFHCADISRTIPVDGTFSDDQKTFYNEVLNCQKEIIDMIEPGVSYNELQNRTVQMLTESMVRLGLLDGDPEELTETPEGEDDPPYKSFFMHKIGHWLGLNVHDVGPYREFGVSEPGWTELKPGMMLTVEPGLYVSGRRNDVPDRWSGMGVRIEDDVVVSEEGCEVLTDDVPKEVGEIEALCQSD